jgi:hypothetical protein
MLFTHAILIAVCILAISYLFPKITFRWSIAVMFSYSVVYYLLSGSLT